jgi:sulfate permease, SulP family
VPSPLVAIVVVGGAAAVFKLVVPTVGDMGELPSSLPTLGLPGVPFALGTLAIIGPVALTLAIIGLLESLMTAQLMDDITDENSDGDRESRGQGIANIATGFLGGMAGCAMIGQSMINLRSGGRTRLSTLTAGIALLVLILVAGSVVSAIPMAALVAVMIVVAISTFQWNSIKVSNLKRSPRSETAVMVVTVAVVVVTHNLALGVLAGVILSAIFFARRVAHVVEVTDVFDTDEVAGSEAGTRVYRVTGELFFASTNELVHSFNYYEETPYVIVDLTDAHIWDSSAVAVLDTVVSKFARHGTHAEIIGLNEASGELHERLSGHLESGH